MCSCFAPPGACACTQVPFAGVLPAVFLQKARGQFLRMLLFEGQEERRRREDLLPGSDVLAHAVLHLLPHLRHHAAPPLLHAPARASRVDGGGTRQHGHAVHRPRADVVPRLWGVPAVRSTIVDIVVVRFFAHGIHTAQ